MADPKTDRPAASRWGLVVLLLSPAIVVPLLVPLYDRTDPELFGFPFYYWFQMALILVAVVLTAVAYQLVRPGRAGHPDRAGSDAESEDRS